jgi:hypothetical protein
MKKKLSFIFGYLPSYMVVSNSDLTPPDCRAFLCKVNKEGDEELFICRSCLSCYGYYDNDVERNNIIRVFRGDFKAYDREYYEYYDV